MKKKREREKRGGERALSLFSSSSLAFFSLPFRQFSLSWLPTTTTTRLETILRLKHNTRARQRARDYH